MVCSADAPVAAGSTRVDGASPCFANSLLSLRSNPLRKIDCGLQRGCSCCSGLDARGRREHRTFLFASRKPLEDFDRGYTDVALVAAGSTRVNGASPYFANSTFDFGSDNELAGSRRPGPRGPKAKSNFHFEATSGELVVTTPCPHGTHGARPHFSLSVSGQSKKTDRQHQDECPAKHHEDPQQHTLE